MNRNAAGRALSAALVLLASACSTQAPPLKLPDVPLAERFSGPAERDGAALQADRWWALYQDPELDGLQQRLLQASPDLAAALARHQQARATSEQLRAAQGPTIGTSLNLQHNRQSEMRPLRVLGPNSPDTYASNTLGLDLAYEIDLWGRVRDQVAAGVAQERAAWADLAAARLALQAQLTDQLIVLRGLDHDGALLADAEAAYAKALELVTQRHNAGIASGLDVARAQQQLDSTRSQRRQSRAQRELVEHGLAALIGDSASTFRIDARPVPLALPAIPVGVPAALLQRRPDIAAAAMRVAAANATVGVAQAAFFPTLNLSVVGGLQSSELSRLIAAPNLFWAVGPTLAANLFDGGRRQAETARARAALDEAGARWRGVVLGAFQQVEDSLALLDHYGAAATSERAALAAAQRGLELATRRYGEGTSSYLDVLTAQTATLQARRSAADLATRQRRASVQLVRALGGGWVEDAGAGR